MQIGPKSPIVKKRSAVRGSVRDDFCPPKWIFLIQIDSQLKATQMPMAMNRELSLVRDWSEIGCANITHFLAEMS